MTPDRMKRRRRRRRPFSFNGYQTSFSSLTVDSNDEQQHQRQRLRSAASEDSFSLKMGGLPCSSIPAPWSPSGRRGSRTNDLHSCTKAPHFERIQPVLLFLILGSCFILQVTAGGRNNVIVPNNPSIGAPGGSSLNNNHYQHSSNSGGGLNTQEVDGGLTVYGNGIMPIKDDGARRRNQHQYHPHQQQHHHHHHHHHEEDLDGYWREIKAIIGGVLGFWGGVGSLGTLFLFVVISQRYCCRRNADKDEG